MKSFVRRCFTLDLRSLALARICLAIVLICDLLIRLSVLDDYHTDSGFLPRSEMVQRKYLAGSICLHLFSGGTMALTALFVFHILCLVCLAVGFRTQLATFFCWVLGNSLQTRNIFVLDSGDRLYLLILLWGFFCQWGAYYSLDAKSKSPPPSRNICNAGTAGLMLQMCIVYWFSCFFKSDPVWWSEGTALYIALNCELFCRASAQYLLPYEGFLRFGTAFTMFAEAVGPILILLGRRWLRMSGVVFLFALHLGIFILMSIGIFPLVSLVLLVAFVPSAVWDFRESEEADSYLTSTGLTTDEEPWQGNRMDALALTFLALIGWWNLHRGFDWPMPTRLFHFCQVLKVDQYWNLFAPVPRTLDCWYVVEGTTDSGTRYNLWEREPKPFSLEKPENVSDIFYCHRDRVWGTALEGIAGRRVQRRFLRVKAERYNREHPNDPVVKMRLYRVKQITALKYRWVKPEPEVLLETDITP